jgi:hypothetical protein
MIDDLTLHDGNGPSEQDRNREMQWTRRAFGSLVLGGFSSAGAVFVNAARSDTIATTWNRMAQTICLGVESRCSILRSATSMWAKVSP